MLMLLRLVPFVESNFNLIELGPRETGKTYAFRNTSNRAFVVSGGKSSVPSLFYNKASKKLGVIGLKHLVFLTACSRITWRKSSPNYGGATSKLM